MKGLTHIENEVMREILDHMCCIAYVSPDKIDFSENGWFSKYTWTKGDQELFKQWLIAYFQDKKEGKKRIEAIAKFPNITKNKKAIERLVDWLILQYAFRVI